MRSSKGGKEFLANDENDFAKPGAPGIRDGIIEDGLPLRAQRLDLFQPAVAAAQAGGGE